MLQIAIHVIFSSDFNELSIFFNKRGRQKRGQNRLNSYSLIKKKKVAWLVIVTWVVIVNLDFKSSIGYQIISSFFYYLALFQSEHSNLKTLFVYYIV